MTKPTPVYCADIPITDAEHNNIKRFDTDNLIVMLNLLTVSTTVVDSDFVESNTNVDFDDEDVAELAYSNLLSTLLKTTTLINTRMDHTGYILVTGLVPSKNNLRVILECN